MINLLDTCFHFEAHRTRHYSNVNIQNTFIRVDYYGMFVHICMCVQYLCFKWVYNVFIYA